MADNNPNVEYNYQKTPNLNTTDTRQAAISKTIGLRNVNNSTRGLYFKFPANYSTPYLAAGSPTLGAKSAPDTLGVYPYAGAQLNV